MQRGLHAVTLLMFATQNASATDDTDAPPSAIGEEDAGLHTEPEAAPTRAPEPGIGTMPDEIAEAARGARHLPIGERMAKISDTLLGRPYQSDPLGEGAGHDPDPLVRYDVFDCLTFVEEVVALSLAGDPAHAGDVRLGLRYGTSDPSYSTRHHFMELQWIPSALEQGWLKDTTKEYGDTVHMEREVTADTWNRWPARHRFALTDEQLPTGTMKLDVLELDTAIAAVDQIRPGTIVLTVRADRAYKPIWISHVGFVVPGDKPTVRHATRMASKTVRDHGLEWYLNHLKTYSKWRAVGVALLEPIEQGPRALSSAPAPDAPVPR